MGKTLVSVSKVTEIEEKPRIIDCCRENLSQCIEGILTEIEEKPRIIDCCRIGNVHAGNLGGGTIPRPTRTYSDSGGLNRSPPRNSSATQITVQQDKVRPIKFSVSNHDHVRQILRKCKTLRTKEGYKSVYLSPDRTVDERRAFRKLLDELRQKRISEPDFVHILKNNKISSVPKDSARANTG